MLDLYKDMGFVPAAGVWELTLRCNMRCKHCGSRAGKSRGEELTIDELLRVADELLELGNERITLSGGEPLLRKEWAQVAKRMTDGGSRVNLISNGYFFDELALEEAQKAGLSNVGFSIDGDQVIHDSIRRCPGSFERVLKALDLCAREGFPATVISFINQSNAHLLDSMVQLFIDHGARAWQPQLGFDYGNLSDHPDLLIKPTQLKEIIPAIAEIKQRRAAEIEVQPADDIGYYTEEEQIFRGRNREDATDFWTGCAAGLRVIGIEANGNIKGCLSMQNPEFVEGNVRQEPLKEIWFKKGNFAYTRDFTVDDLSGFCRECQYNEICRGGCSWNSFLHGRGEGKRTNLYCLYRVYAEEGLVEGTFTPQKAR